MEFIEVIFNNLVPVSQKAYPHYEARTVNAVYGSNPCFFCELFEGHKYTAGKMQN
jgi:hypothetical protein